MEKKYIIALEYSVDRMWGYEYGSLKFGQWAKIAYCLKQIKEYPADPRKKERLEEEMLSAGITESMLRFWN